jgi:hypothetical protein
MTFSQLLPSVQHYMEFTVFFTTCILKLIREQDESSGIVHCIVSKLSRCLAKLKGHMLIPTCLGDRR